MTEPSVLEMIEKARKAQQRYYQTHDVQLEIDLDPEEEDAGSADIAVASSCEE